MNSSTEPAHANTEASVSGYRLYLGTRSMNFEKLPPGGKKMKNCMLGVLVIKIAE